MIQEIDGERIIYVDSIWSFNVLFLTPSPAFPASGEGASAFDRAVTVPPLPAGEVAQRAGGGQHRKTTSNDVSHQT